MSRPAAWTTGALVACLLLLDCQAARAVIVISGNGNTDANSLATVEPDFVVGLPGFANVGSTGSASAVYLQNGWVITANHVSLGSSVSFGGNAYTIDAATITQLINNDGSGKPADLKMFRLTTDPGLPAITASLLASATPNGRQIMIGNGLNIDGGQVYWHVDKTSPPWDWEEVQTPPADAGADDYSGYKLIGSNTVRWGENNVFNQIANVDTMTIRTLGYTTQFNFPDYAPPDPLDNEAQATGGDSGGAVFTDEGGQWVLGGIMFNISGPNSGQPSSIALFGDRTYIADMSKYRSQILALVPEPSSFALAGVAAAGVALLYRRRLWPRVSSRPLDVPTLSLHGRGSG